MDIALAILAAGVAAGYFTIAAAIMPRLPIEGASRRFVMAARVGGVAFFAGCGLTHTHITVHALTETQLIEWHELIFHALQVVGVWVVVFAALRMVDVTIVRRRSAEERQAEELRGRVGELARSNADLEQFAHVVSHDLQEPLRTVSGFADLLDRRYSGRLDDSGDEFLRHIVEGCQRMSGMLEGVLTYSRAAGAGLHVEEVALDDVISDACGSLARTIADTGGRISSDPLPVVPGDRVQLEQLVQNLLANGLRYTDGRPPEIHVAAERTNGMWRVDVRDNGVGVDPARAEALFGMFVRGHHGGNGSAPDGTGIGLAVCRKIVERHGGALWVQPNPQGGSVFSFTLPAAAATVPVTRPSGSSSHALRS